MLYACSESEQARRQEITNKINLMVDTITLNHTLLNKYLASVPQENGAKSYSVLASLRDKKPIKGKFVKSDSIRDSLLSVIEVYTKKKDSLTNLLNTKTDPPQ
jgi:hypothetical protein